VLFLAIGGKEKDILQGRTKKGLFRVIFYSSSSSCPPEERSPIEGGGGLFSGGRKTVFVGRRGFMKEPDSGTWCLPKDATEGDLCPRSNSQACYKGRTEEPAHPCPGSGRKKEGKGPRQRNEGENDNPTTWEILLTAPERGNTALSGKHFCNRLKKKGDIREGGRKRQSYVLCSRF